jgi:uncharacterized membrane protein YqjE
MDTTAARSASGADAAANDGNRTLVRLFMDLWRETSTLVHDEVELARVEVAEKVSEVGTGITAIGAAVVVLFAGFLILLLAAVNALAMFLPEETAPWLAPLIIGVVVLVVGFIALAKGRANLKVRNLAPERTIESIRRDRELVKEHVK